MRVTTDSKICLYEENGCESSSYGSIESISNIDTIPENSVPNGNPSSKIKAYRRRFWMLSLFSTLSLLSGMLFPQFITMADVTKCFYGVNDDAVNWTGLSWMVVYVFLVFPVSWLMNRVGLRVIVLLGSLANTAACSMQFLTLNPDNFGFVMVTAFLGSLSNVFVLAIPPCIAAIWFPSNEVSRACAMGVFGNQLGIALGFVVSPLLISSDCSRKDLIAAGKEHLAIVLTSVNVVILILVCLTFEREPILPPSIAQAEKKNVNVPYMQSALTMARNKHFVLLFITYGLMVGTYFAIATVLNSMILYYFPGAHEAVGWIGLLVIVAGLIGSVIAGYILDYTHKFKETCIAVCCFSTVSYIVFSCLLSSGKLWIQFITFSILGFFLTSFLPVGFEFGIEVTYPESEIVSSGLLNSATMIFGLFLTEAASAVNQKYGPVYIHIVLGLALLASSLISVFITKEYKRSKKNSVEIISTKL